MAQAQPAAAGAINGFGFKAAHQQHQQHRHWSRSWTAWTRRDGGNNGGDAADNSGDDAPRDDAAAAAAAAAAPAAASRSPQAADLLRALDRVQQGAVRGAAIGLTLRGGLHLASYLVSLLSRGGGSGGRARQQRRKARVGGGDALLDTLRYGAFLGALAATYIGVEEGIARVFGRGRSSGWRALVAGACAGPTLLLAGRQQRHYSLALYILLRGLTLLIRTGNRAGSPLLRALLAPTRMAHGDALLMCACCSQIIYAFIMHPETLPPSYVRFIQKQADKEEHVLRGIQELALRTAAGLPPAPLAALAGTPHADCAHGAIPCGFFHPGQTCAGHALSLLPPNYMRALRVYLPVYLLPALLVHRKALLRDPLPILRKAAAGVARSALFLSLLICGVFGGACAGHRVLGRTGPAVLALSTWVGGLALLVEKKSRRMELSTYVLSRSLESAARCLAAWGWVRPRALPARADVLLFAAGCGAIMHCYSDGNGRHRACFRSKYLNLLDFVFGAEGVGEGRISHAPSNAELLRAAGMRVSRSLGSLTNLAALGGGGNGGNGNGGNGSGGGGNGGGGFGGRGAARSASFAQLPALAESPVGGASGGGGGAVCGAVCGASSAGGGGGAAQNHQQQQQQPSPDRPLSPPAAPPAYSGRRPPLAPGSGGGGGGAPRQRKRSLSLDDADALALAP